MKRFKITETPNTPLTGSGPSDKFSDKVPSSSGLGYCPLTAETRVRFPLGLPKNINGLAVKFVADPSVDNPVDNLRSSEGGSEGLFFSVQRDNLGRPPGQHLHGR